MRNILEVSAFTTPVSVPENGDAVAAETRDPSLQALANRTAYLKAAHETLEAEHDALLVNPGQITLPATASLVRYLSARSVGPGGGLFPFDDSWTLLDGGYLSTVNRARAYWDLTPHWKRYEQIERILVGVAPGTARPTAGDRMAVQLMRGNYGVSFATFTPTTTVVATETDDGNAGAQWVDFDFTGAPILVSAGATWELRLITGVDSATAGSPDAVYVIVYQLGASRIGNG